MINKDFPTYISGYVDGEGCFCISSNPRQKLKLGWEVRPSFSVSQNKDRSSVLYAIQEYFGCGSIRPDSSDNTLKYEVRSLNDLIDKVIPFFDKHPLLSEKQNDFFVFKQVCEIMNQKGHIQSAGFETIVTRVKTMNTSGKHTYHFVQKI